MTPTEINQALEKIGGRPNKKLGQHFLIDAVALDAIVGAADIHQGDHVLEVGPGLGVLTDALLHQGANVTAIEQDRRFLAHLTSQYPEGLTVIHGDAARLDWMDFVRDGQWKFVSNLPYSISSLALRKALWNENPPAKVVVLVQREVAERAIAKEGKTSLLSLMVALASRTATLVRRVPAGAFYPPPQVESAILAIEPLSQAERLKKWGINPEKVMALAKKGFAHPRKLLSSNLGLTADMWKPIADRLGIDPRVRAEDLSPELWVALARDEQATLVCG
ncbi:MAG: 16S rRNA (adenine(1518)-N(6)/adenine(1519)-N(6))-dimethyltransferase RsmA [Patescibacteria group bacterium]